jgi:hypothetical protein
MKYLLSLLAVTVFLLGLCSCPPALAAVNTANVLSINTATTNITTGAYVTLGSISASFAPSQIVVVNTTAQVVKLAFGAAGSETDFISILPSGMEVIRLERHFMAGTRLSLEAVSATASSGFVSISLVP